jgi:elongation factor Ts
MNIEMGTLKELRTRTNLSLNDCKKALEQSDNNIENAIDLLKQWNLLKSKEKETAETNEGIVIIARDKDVYRSSYAAAMVEVNCQTDFLGKSQEFIDFSNEVANNIMLDHRGVPTDKTNTENLRHKLIAMSGENVVVRRSVLFEPNNDNSRIFSYVHSNNKLGVLVEIECKSSDNMFFELANDICLQIAAMNPDVICKDDLSQDVIDRQKSIFEAQLKEENKPAVSWEKIIEGKLSRWMREVVLLKQESIKENKKSVSQIIQEVSSKIGQEIKIVRFERYAI